jgi:hypothetical protein
MPNGGAAWMLGTVGIETITMDAGKTVSKTQASTRP